MWVVCRGLVVKVTFYSREICAGLLVFPVWNSRRSHFKQITRKVLPSQLKDSEDIPSVSFFL